MRTQRKIKQLLLLSSFIIIHNIADAQWVTSGNNVYINTGGNVGIGTTTPTGKLEIVGYAGNMKVDSSGAKITFTRNNANYIDAASSGGFLIFNTNGSQERMRINADGNVGIGTNSPVAKLQVTNGTQNILLGAGTNTSGYSASLGANDDGVNIATNVATRGFNFKNSNGTLLTIMSGGNVGIGVTSPQTKLAVNGDISAKRVKVTQTGWADYVFAEGYQLPSLKDVEAFIKTNKHLPDVPSAAEVAKDGLDVGEMNKILLQKVEELTLYLIEIRKENAAIIKENKDLKNRVKAIEKNLATK